LVIEDDDAAQARLPFFVLRAFYFGRHLPGRRLPPSSDTPPISPGTGDRIRTPPPPPPAAGRTRARSSSGGGRSLPVRRVLRDPLAPFSRLLPLRACIPLPSVCPSLLLFCARRAPAKILRNTEISKNLSKAPLRANCCRGVGAFLCVVVGSDSGE
jgi:hypothetical protein